MATRERRHVQRQLSERLDRLHRSSGDFRAVFFDLANAPFAGSEAHERMALHMIVQGMRDRDGEVYTLCDHILVCISTPDLSEMVRGLIADARALSPEEDWRQFLEECPGQPFCVEFPLGAAYAACQAHLEAVSKVVEREEARLASIEEARREEERRRAKVSGGAKAKTEVPAPVQLEFIERQLEEIDFLRLVRSQPICRAEGDALGPVVGQEAYTSIADLQKFFATKIRMQDHYLLLQHLVRHLDIHMISAVADADLLSRCRPLHLNISMSTLSSDVFAAFDADSTAAQRHGLVLELSWTDGLAHSSELVEAVDYLSARGYSVALDGVAVEGVESLRLDTLPVSHIKVIWRRGKAVPDGLAAAVRRLEASSRAKVVLCRCDDEVALRWGLQGGFSYFQGAVTDAAVSRAFFGACSKRSQLGCTLDKCRARHWAIGRHDEIPCPRPFWTSPSP